MLFRSDLPAVATALEAVFTIAGPDGRRAVPAADFFADYLTTTLAPDEILVEVRLPAMEAAAGWAFEEFARRHGDFALIGVASMLLGEIGERIERRCRQARLAVSGAGPVPVRLRDAEAILEREGVGDVAIAAAARAAAAAVTPDADIHASVEYRRHLTEVLTERALTRARARVGGASSAGAVRP